MTSNAIQPSITDQSPFDQIKQVGEDGSEYCSARELMPKMGYTKWQNMLGVIGRARAACRNTGHDPASIFTDVSIQTEVSGRSGLDVKMLRFGCYLVAMNGDPDKPEIAAAQHYFAVMTRVAELQVVVPVPAEPEPEVDPLVHQARMFLAYAERQAETTRRLVTVEQAVVETGSLAIEANAKADNALAIVTGGTGYVTVLGFCRTRGLNLDRREMADAGMRITRHCKLHGIEIKSVADEHYGQVNTYPVGVMERWLESRSATVRN